jgi:heme exporter protein A
MAAAVPRNDPHVCCGVALWYATRVFAERRERMVTDFSEPAIDARQVARRFGARWVLRGITMEVRAGEIVGLLGANGSGKTTLLRILGTLLKPNVGVARVYGHDVALHADAVRREIGFLAHGPGVYPDLTARENLRFAVEMMCLPPVDLTAALTRFGLESVADERVRGFSAGMLRRLALARLMLRQPSLLLLDEPYSNLDSAGIALMNAVIADVRQSGGAALIVLHELAPAEGMLDRTVTIVDGRIAADGAARNDAASAAGASVSGAGAHATQGASA